MMQSELSKSIIQSETAEKESEKSIIDELRKENIRLKEENQMLKKKVSQKNFSFTSLSKSENSILSLLQRKREKRYDHTMDGTRHIGIFLKSCPTCNCYSENNRAYLLNKDSLL